MSKVDSGRLYIPECLVLSLTCSVSIGRDDPHAIRLISKLHPDELPIEKDSAPAITDQQAVPAGMQLQETSMGGCAKRNDLRTLAPTRTTQNAPTNIHHGA